MKRGVDISFHPTDSNRLEVGDSRDTHVYNVDDGSKRPDEKMEGETKCHWSKDGAVKIAKGKDEIFWTHCKSKNESRLKPRNIYDDLLLCCFVEEKNETCAK